MCHRDHGRAMARLRLAGSYAIAPSDGSVRPVEILRITVQRGRSGTAASHPLPSFFGDPANDRNPPAADIRTATAMAERTSAFEWRRGGLERLKWALCGQLAARATVLLGQEDVGSKNLATSEEAEEQDGTRLERSETVFREVELTARQNGWVFNWHPAVVPGVRHSAGRMLTSNQAFVALRP